MNMYDFDARPDSPEPADACWLNFGEVKVLTSEKLAKKFKTWYKKHRPGTKVIRHTPTGIGHSVVIVDQTTHDEIDVTEYNWW